jgi:D-proline reductase (dithiol) PrdB
MPFSYVDYMTKLMAPKPYPPQPNFNAPQLTPLRKPIEESTIGVLTSCGAQLKDDKPMAETNDLSYRLLHRDIPLSELKVSHMTPVRKWALEDLNVAFPRDRLIELEKEGVFTKLAPNAISVVGSITLYTELLNDMVPRIKQEFDEQGVDLALIFPF